VIRPIAASVTRIRKAARHARDFTQQRVPKNCPPQDPLRERNRTKSKVRAKVEHCFLIIKRIFGFDKVRYRGLAKNRHRLQVTCAHGELVQRPTSSLAGGELKMSAHAAHGAAATRTDYPLPACNVVPSNLARMVIRGRNNYSDLP